MNRPAGGRLLIVKGQKQWERLHGQYFFHGDAVKMEQVYSTPYTIMPFFFGVKHVIVEKCADLFLLNYVTRKYFCNAEHLIIKEKPLILPLKTREQVNQAKRRFHNEVCSAHVWSRFKYTYINQDYMQQHTQSAHEIKCTYTEQQYQAFLKTFDCVESPIKQ
jgi:hypothetical protein